MPILNCAKLRILLADDNSSTRRQLLSVLRARGFEVMTAETEQSALRLVSSGSPDAIVLGPGIAGHGSKGALQHIRVCTDTPLLMVSDRTRPEEIVEAFESGADDYIAEPVDPDILAARVRAVLRRVARNGHCSGVLKTGTITVDLARHEVKVRGRPVDLTPKEYDLLSYLMLNAGRMLTFRQILKAVWGDGQAYKRQYLRVYVMHLRRKLELDPEMPRYIHSQLGVGYRFDPPSCAV